MYLDFEARGGDNWVRAIWSVPGAASLRRIILYSLCGTPPARWFSPVDASTAALHPRYKWSALALRLGSLLNGVAVPSPIHVPLNEPLLIARWMSETLRTGRIPQLYTYASSAVRLCLRAHEAGLSLKGAQFVLGAEPVTAPRLAVIERTGAKVHVQCGSVETGTMARGCLFRRAPDDLHLLDDRWAVVQPGSLSLSGLPPRALLITSISLSMAKLILLNVSLGDQAELERRSCGCPLEKLGWQNHVHHIRSFEKLTAGGMTFLDADLVRALEQILPAGFGGGPTDYQLVEEETEDGTPHIRLLVHPRLGPLNTDALRELFLETIGKGSGVERVMMSVWRDHALPIVEREAPRITASGKILHVHLARQKESASDRAEE